ncbi:hypothetical protein HYQ45_003868 [Verticillium longisporum]|uniref:Uncharacterized protein n=1 Tax=Verticillium longisporum TaxID=100787 RepID=A0A8I2ZUA7_VERLO|nr:hypothetical protein HYQ45_003868 [Verticillium longisporum]
MDWVQDFSGLNASDLERGFRYHWRSSTVVKLSSTGKLLTRSLNSEKDWQKWLDDEVPNLDYKNVDGGLILLLTSRCDRPKPTIGPVELWNEKETKEKDSIADDPIADDSTLCNPSRSNTQSSGVVLQHKEAQGNSGSGGTRSIRDLPFSREVFESIIRRFHTHGTLARTISRADIPAFSASNVYMQSSEGGSYRSYVYNARTSEEWEGDLALTATYFPCHRLTFGILFGCDETIEAFEAGSTRIVDRLDAIIEEYDEKIRDSAMRLDGMAMATQWSYSDTNVEIALATTRDSKHMRSISLITMIFLPGTFLATIFSMTFFDWGDGTGKARVSGMIWIYFALAFGFTAVTLGSWYFWTSRRRRTKNISHC